MNEDFRTIEVNGIKLEVDLRQARRVDVFKVGDTVKVLDSRNDKNELKTGVITDFANFKELPTMTIALYKQPSYWEKPNIEFIPYNAETKDIEVVPVTAEELKVSRSGILERFDDEIAKKREELHDLMVKRDTFYKYFASDND
jgi:hypothetical protein